MCRSRAWACATISNYSEDPGWAGEKSLHITVDPPTEMKIALVQGTPWGFPQLESNGPNVFQEVYRPSSFKLILFMWILMWFCKVLDWKCQIMFQLQGGFF